MFFVFCLNHEKNSCSGLLTLVFATKRANKKSRITTALKLSKLFCSCHKHLQTIRLFSDNRFSYIFVLTPPWVELGGELTLRSTGFVFFVQSIFADRYTHSRVVSGIIRKRVQSRISREAKQ